MKRISKAVLGGVAGCGLILGATPLASGENPFTTYLWPWSESTDLRPAHSGGPLDGASATLRIIESADEGTGFRLKVEGINVSVAKPEFGGHLHIGPCETPEVLTTSPSISYSDPTNLHYKNDSGTPSPQNEVWFTLAPDEEGVATDETWVSFRPTDPDGIMSVVLHENPTSTAPVTAGKAGNKEACLPVLVEDWKPTTGG